jgi:hypothetical protein
VSSPPPFAQRQGIKEPGDDGQKHGIRDGRPHLTTPNRMQKQIIAIVGEGARKDAKGVLPTRNQLGGFIRTGNSTPARPARGAYKSHIDHTSGHSLPP